MTKSERLIYLINMIRNRGPVLVSEMTAETGVSARTIYRDMNSLAKMNFPIHYSNGYRFIGESSLPMMQLSAEELDLLRYAVRHNPLNRNAYFERRFRDIEQKLVSGRRSKRSVETQDVIIFDRKAEVMPSDASSQLLAKFMEALCEKRKIDIRLKDSSRRLDQLIPVAVKIHDTECELLVATDRSTIAERIDLEQVEAIRLSDQKYTWRPIDTSYRLGTEAEKTLTA